MNKKGKLESLPLNIKAILKIMYLALVPITLLLLSELH